MRRAASRAKSRLPDAGRSVAFLRSQLCPDGGFRNRAGHGDLYYTVFGLEALAALGEPPPDRLPVFLRRFANLDSLDFVHLTCLARCMGGAVEPGQARHILRRIETFRTPDGGYSQWPGAKCGTTYGCILALGTYQDLGQASSLGRPVNGEGSDATIDTRDSAMSAGQSAPPDPGRLLDCLRSLRTPDGGYLNEPGQSAGLTPATAAAITVQAELGGELDERAVNWLLARHMPGGGFAAFAGVPLADLLSTATALHALSRAGVDLLPIAEPCRRFVLSMWADGGFRGHGLDDARDCEYLFYGLLALGELC